MKLNEHYFSEFGSPALKYIHTTPIVNKISKVQYGGRDSGIWIWRKRLRYPEQQIYPVNTSPQLTNHHTIVIRISVWLLHCMVPAHMNKEKSSYGPFV